MTEPDEYMFAERDEVVRAIRKSLPEFCERNKVRLPENVLDNLAYWVTSVVPANMARNQCPNTPYACACLGMCQYWRQVPEHKWGA